MKYESDIPYEEITSSFPEGAVILCGDPLPDKTADEVRRLADNAKTTQELIDLFAGAWNKYGYIEDSVYDYEEDTKEYEEVCAYVDSWGDLMIDLGKKVEELAKSENALGDGEGMVGRLEPFMARYGYRDGAGWWASDSL